MGSQNSKDYSSDQNSKKIINNMANNSDVKFLDIAVSSVGNIFSDTSSFKGITPEYNNTSNNNIENENTSNNNTQNKISTKFEWREGGEEVLITGSFCEWNEKFNMNKNDSNGFFELKILLPKGKYEFKFVVDGVWRCSNNYPQINDNRGNVNNYIDIDNSNKEKESPKKRQIEPNNNKLVNIEEFKKCYTNNYPNKSLLNNNAPKLPDVYNFLMNINDNSNQKYIGTKKFLDIRKLDMNESFKSVKQPYHSYLNHIFSKSSTCEIQVEEENKYRNIRYNNNNSIYKNGYKNNKNTNFGINCCFKTGNKCISIVYYCPIVKN